MLQARLRTLSLTALTATLAALVMLIIKISPLKDIPFYFLPLLTGFGAETFRH